MVATSVSTLSVFPIGYAGLQVNWSVPSGNWNEQILLRSAFGTPQSVFEGDGQVLLDQLFSTSPTTTFNDNGLRPGHFYYYSLLVFNTDLGEYVMAGAAQGLVLTYYGFDKTFYSWTPDWYQELDAQLIGNPLQQFLALLGYEMDWIRSEIESLFLFTNIELASGALIPYIGANYGMSYEPELGMARSRVLVKNAVFLYKNKGTVTGIQAAGSAFSGYPVEITIGPNQEIQLDDSAFDQSVGHWVAGNNTSTISIVTAISQSVTPAHNSYIPSPGYVGYLPTDNINVGEFTATGQQAYFSTCTSANALELGIPVVQQATPALYVVSGYFQPSPQATPTRRSFFMQIDWYGQYGNLISSSIGISVTEIYGQWVRAYVVASPPAGAVVFGRTFKSTVSLSGDMHLFDAEQVEINTQATPGPSAWQPPRDIKINLLPLRQNLISNPQGFSGLTGWSATGGLIQASASLATPPAVTWPAETTQGFVITSEPGSTAVSGGALYGGIFPGGTWYGAGILGGSLGGSPGSTLIITTVPVNANVAYSLSIYMMAATTARQIQLSVGYFNALGQLISPTVFTTTLSAPLVMGQTYSALPVNALPSFAVVNVGEGLLINAGGTPQQLVHVSGPVASMATSVPVNTFQASANYPAGTQVGFAYVNFTDTVGSFTRGATINLITPPNAVLALIQATIINPASFEIHYLGAPLFEPLGYLLPYFDANFLPASDYSWEGTPNNSISDYYPALPSKLARLISVMPQYTPMGSTFSLVTGNQALANVGLLG